MLEAVTLALLFILGALILLLVLGALRLFFAAFVVVGFVVVKWWTDRKLERDLAEMFPTEFGEKEG